MQLPARIVEIVQALNAQYQNLSTGTDDQRRQLSTLMQEQIVFEFGARWGGKARSGSNMPLSKDAIAYQEDDATVSVWDWQNGSTRQSILQAGSEPTYPHLPTSDAQFIAQQPVNHLNGVKPTPAVDQFAIDLIALYAEFGDPPPPPDVIEAHRGNPGGLPAIRQMLMDAHQSTPSVPPSVPSPPLTDPDLVALIRAFIPTAIDSQVAMQASLLALHVQVLALTEQIQKHATAYVRADLKPILPGSPTAAYFKFSLGEPLK